MGSASERDREVARALTTMVDAFDASFPEAVYQALAAARAEEREACADIARRRYRQATAKDAMTQREHGEADAAIGIGQQIRARGGD